MPANNQSTLTTKSVLRQGGTTFLIDVLGPGKTVVDKPEEKLSFPAFITSISDSFSPTWESYNDMGRADPKVMYSQFSRQLTISWKTVALKIEEARAIYQKLDILARAVHPHYVAGKGFVGRFVKFSIAKLYINEYGYINSLNVSIDNSTPWDTDEEGSGEWPIVTNIDMGITWIGDKRPDAGKSRSYSDAQDRIVRIAELKDAQSGESKRAAAANQFNFRRP